MSVIMKFGGTSVADAEAMSRVIKIVKQQIETDRAEILSGVRKGETLGGPIALLIRNKDWDNWQNTMHVGAQPPENAPGARRAASCISAEASTSDTSA